MNRIENLSKVRENKEGILSVSLAASGGRWDEIEFMEIVDLLTRSGLNQLLTIHVDSNAFKSAETAPAEITMSNDGLIRGAHLDTMIPKTLKTIRDRYPNLPIIASGNTPDFVCYGYKRFLKKCNDLEIEAIDNPLYPAITDPLGLRKDAEEAGIYYICCMHVDSLQMDDPEHVQLFEELIRISRGELFMVPALPTTANGFNGKAIAEFMDRVNQTKEKYKAKFTVISIGGVDTPEDAYQLVKIGGTDGVHFSSAFINRILKKQPFVEIEKWLQEVKDAMLG